MCVGCYAAQYPHLVDVIYPGVHSIGSYDSEQKENTEIDSQT